MKKSKTRKKTSASVIVLTLILVAVLGFCTYWIATNFETVKSGLDGTKLYTQEEITEAYNKGLADKTSYEEQLNDWMSKYEASKKNYNDALVLINEYKAIKTAMQEETEPVLNNEETKALWDEIEAIVNALELQVETLKAELEEIAFNGETKVYSAWFEDYVNNAEYLTAIEYNVHKIYLTNFSANIAENIAQLAIELKQNEIASNVTVFIENFVIPSVIYETFQNYKMCITNVLFNPTIQEQLGITQLEGSPIATNRYKIIYTLQDNTGAIINIAIKNYQIE